MRGNSHVRFLGESAPAMAQTYPTSIESWQWLSIILRQHRISIAVVTRPVCSQAAGPSAKAGWLPVETAALWPAAGQDGPNVWHSTCRGDVRKACRLGRAVWQDGPPSRRHATYPASLPGIMTTAILKFSVASICHGDPLPQRILLFELVQQRNGIIGDGDAADALVVYQ